MKGFDKTLLELSPDGLRRSQRASAIRAQQRIRGQPNGEIGIKEEETTKPSTVIKTDSTKYDEIPNQPSVSVPTF